MKRVVTRLRPQLPQIETGNWPYWFKLEFEGAERAGFITKPVKFAGTGFAKLSLNIGAA